MAVECNQGSGSPPNREAERLRAWLENPRRLLNLLGTAPAHAGVLHRESIDLRLLEEDVAALVRLLAQVVQASQQVKDESQAGQLAAYFCGRLQGLPVDLVAAVEQALAQMSVPLPAAAPLPVQLGEQLARRLVLDSYQRGELSAAGARALLARMSEETATLRRVLGLPVASNYLEQLEDEFWESVAEPERRRVLLSPDAWCLPPRALAAYLEQVRDQPGTAQAILEHYANCVHSAHELARWRAARVLARFAESYARYGGALLESALRHAGNQLAAETKPEIQEILATAFACLTREAASRRGFRALCQSLRLLETVEAAHPPGAQGLRARVGLSAHVRDFVEEAAQIPLVPGDLRVLLRQVPSEAADILCEAFENRKHRVEQNRLAALAQELGPAGVHHLRERLRAGSPSVAVSAVGLLSRLDPAALEEVLPARLAGWERSHHDRLVRLLGGGGAPERGQLLLRLLDSLDPLVLPGALDEIGMSGDRRAAPRLMRVAEGTTLQSSEPYLRLKALEALGRLREPAAGNLLRRLVESKAVWRWSEPREIRLAAAQALMKIDPQWAEKCLPQAGLQPEELAVGPLDPQPAAPWVRYRRYPRLSLPEKLPTLIHTLRGPCALATKVLSLGGGLAECGGSLPSGTEVEVEFKAGRRPLRATALVRNGRPQMLGFEIVRIDLNDRLKLRHLLADLAPAAA